MHTYVCVSRGKKCSLFGKICRALFPWNTRLEIRLFGLLQRNIEFRAEICIRELLSWKQSRYYCFQGSNSLHSANLTYFFQIIVASYIIYIFFRKNRIRMRRLFYLKNIWKRKHFWLNMIPNFWRFESVFFNFSRSFQIVLHDSAKRSLEIFPQKQTEFLNNFTKGHFKWLSLESTYMH